MRGLDIKSAAIGALSAVLAGVVLGAGQATTVPVAESRYQIAGNGGEVLVLDRQTNVVSVLVREADTGRARGNWAWVRAGAFSIPDAVGTEPRQGFVPMARSLRR